MKKILFILLPILCIVCISLGMLRTIDTISRIIDDHEPFTVDIWPDGYPASNGLEGQEIDFDGGTHLISHPIMDIYPASQPSGLAILACPGGGYVDCWHHHEGSDMASWMSEHGVTLAVLHYRMPNGHSDIPLQDAQQAMEILRTYASQLGYSRIGVMGFSAGGHLASTVATHWTTEANRPDFQVLIYPVISMDEAITHIGSRENLLDLEPSDSLIRFYSNDLQVNAQTPPAFIALSGDDDVVPITNSLRYYQALQSCDVPASLHMYPEGSHGWGFRPSPFFSLWTSALASWLQTLDI